MQINLSCPVNTLGYGQAGINICKALDELGHEVTLCPIGPVEAEPHHHEMLQRCIQRAAFFGMTAPSVRIYHQFAMAESVGWGLRIGFPIFELDAFSEQEKHHLNSLDHVFVTCGWAKEVVLSNTNHTDEQVDVIPLGVDRSVFNGVVPEGIVKDSATTFLNVGKWEHRKGQMELAYAFNQAFDPQDNVRLVLHCHNPFLTPEEVLKFTNPFSNSKMSQKVMYTGDRNLSHAQVANLMHMADCGVFPSRAEGWNLEALEMMSCGKPIIATDYSAHTEYCNHDNSLLISCSEKEPAYDGKWFHGQGEWMAFDDFQIDQLIHHMRSIHRKKQIGDELFNQAGIDTADQFTWQHTAQFMVTNLASLTGEIVESNLCIGSDKQ